MAMNTDPFYQIYSKALDTIVGSSGIVPGDGDDLYWRPNPPIITGQPWIAPNTGGGPHYVPHTSPLPTYPPLPAGPLSPLQGGGTITNSATININIPMGMEAMKELIGNYRFLIKSIRSLANAGKLNPEVALQAIDALLMALDDNYDKMDAQAAK